ncbi:MAG TPA: alpha/beta fold hydrolase [Polyangiaceae bacterium]
MKKLVEAMLRSKLLWVAGGAVILAAPAALAWRAYSAEVRVFFPKRHPLTVPLAQAGILNLQALSIEGRNQKLGAWYAPSRNGATIVICHGAGGDRSQLLDEARALATHGFGTLMFDWPGHGESDGVSSWHDAERQSLHAVLDWFEKQPEAKGQSIGALGFSLGGYILVQVATSRTGISSLALVGTPSNLNQQVRLAHQNWRLIREPAARFALSTHGIDLGEPQPAHLIGKFAPAPVLVIGGGRDGTVPPQLTRELFDAAGDPRQLYFIDAAEHGSYALSGGAAYLSRVVEHFQHTLLPKP